MSSVSCAASAPVLAVGSEAVTVESLATPVSAAVVGDFQVLLLGALEGEQPSVDSESEGNAPSDGDANVAEALEAGGEFPAAAPLLQMLPVSLPATRSHSSSHEPMTSVDTDAMSPAEIDESDPLDPSLSALHKPLNPLHDDGASSSADQPAATSVFGWQKPLATAASDPKDESGAPAHLTSLTAPVALATSSPEAAVAAERLSPRLDSPVGSAFWRQELANRINLMIDRGEQSATLRLSPDHLGPLEVRIAVREGETSLWFGAAHADTRQALELAMPRLREQFASAGLSLGHSWVSQGPPRESRQMHNALSHGFGTNNDSDSTAIGGVENRSSRVWGLIDTYV